MLLNSVCSNTPIHIIPNRLFLFMRLWGICRRILGRIKLVCVEIGTANELLSPHSQHKYYRPSPYMVRDDRDVIKSSFNTSSTRCQQNAAIYKVYENESSLCEQ